MLGAAPDAAMTALALNISGLYLGTGVAGALGGVVLSVWGAEFIPLVAGLLLLGALGWWGLERPPHPARSNLPALTGSSYSTMPWLIAPTAPIPVATA